MNFPADLVARVRSSLDLIGYCFLSADEIRRLLTGVPANLRARQQAMEEFAEICGAEVDIAAHLKSARFIPQGVPSDTARREKARRRTAASALTR